MPAVLLVAVNTGEHTAKPVHGESQILKQLAHMPRMVGDAELLFHRPGDHGRGPDSSGQPISHRPAVQNVAEAAALCFRQTAPAARTGNLPRGPRRREPDTEPTTRTPWSTAPSEFLPDRCSFGLRNSGIPLAGVSPRGTHHPAPPPYSTGSTDDKSGDATAAGEEPPPLLLREAAIGKRLCPFNYARMYCAD
jgi:hypothetical protein